MIIYLHSSEYNTDMAAKTILLGAGEKMLAQRLCEVLNEAHYVVDLAPDGNRCKRMFNMYNYDMVLVERQLPDIDGIELCNYVRDRDADIPLMVLSRGGDESKLEVLRSRVDDYLVITQDCRELLLRIKVLARRFCRPHKQKNRIGAGDIVIDIDDKMVTKGDKSIFLSARSSCCLNILSAIRTGSFRGRRSLSSFMQAKLRKKNIGWPPLSIPYAARWKTTMLKKPFLQSRAGDIFWPKRSIRPPKEGGLY